MPELRDQAQGHESSHRRQSSGHTTGTCSNNPPQIARYGIELLNGHRVTKDLAYLERAETNATFLINKGRRARLGAVLPISLQFLNFGNPTIYCGRLGTPRSTKVEPRRIRRRRRSAGTWKGSSPSTSTQFSWELDRPSKAFDRGATAVRHQAGRFRASRGLLYYSLRDHARYRDYHCYPHIKYVELLTRTRNG